MKRGRMLTRAILFLVGIGLSLSACAVGPGAYGGYPYDPVYGWYGGWGDGFAHGGFGGHGGADHR